MDKCPHFKLVVKDNMKESKGKGRSGGTVSADRRVGLPYVIIKLCSHSNIDGEPKSDTDILIDIFNRDNSLDLTPDEAIELGTTLIALAEDCKKYPDRRGLRKKHDVRIVSTL